jgi:diguanylate cyclase (GGDEF)-like protein
MSHKILVIEDNPISRKMVRVALQAEGYTVIEAPDGKTALTLMIEQKPDLVLQDLLLPDVNGFDLLAQLRKVPSAAKIPILALTGLIAKADELRLADAPFTDYLFKPLEPSLLVSTVRSHLPLGEYSPEKPGKNRRILVVDDESSQLKLLATYLSHLGFEVATASNGNDGLVKAREYQPDAIISDVLMPGLDGFQLCIKIRQDPELARVPILLRSNSYDQAGDKELARKVGAYALVPTDPEFREVIRSLLESLESAPAPLACDTQTFQNEYKERVARQLDRQAMVAAQLAQRCAAQTAQISVLASIGENFRQGQVDKQALLNDVLAQYLNVTGFSCGAMYLIGSDNQLDLSAQIGFPDEVVKSLPSFFGFKGVLHDFLQEGKPVSFVVSPSGQAPFARLLSNLRAQTLLITPLRFRNEQLGVIAVISALLRPSPDCLTFSNALTDQIGQVIAFSRVVSRLQYLASYDSLTDLPNRTQLCERVRLAIAKGNHSNLFLLNLDRFQEINNTLGYRNGNVLLCQFARRLEETFAGQAFVARLGADEFAVLSLEPPGAAVDRTARKILTSLEPAFRLDGLQIAVRGRVGIALIPEHGSDPDTLLSYADLAQRAARRTGNDYLIYPAHVEPYSPDLLALLGELREAIEQDQLELYYQPKVSFKTGQPIGVEALLRWRHATRGWIAPDQFIPLAEKAGLIHSITLWVLPAAVKQAQFWRNRGLNISVAVNISARDLQDSTFPDVVLQICRSTATPLEVLTLELTETAVMADPAKTEAAFQRLKDMGVRLSIDDFGTGYSSFSYLQKLPANEIKIDKSFVAGMLTDPRSAAIVRSIIDLGRNLRLSVVAEGIEDRPTWDVLADLCCEAGQGYHICRPLPPEELVEWVNRSPWRAQPYGTRSVMFNRDSFVDDER